MGAVAALCLILSPVFPGGGVAESGLDSGVPGVTGRGVVVAVVDTGVDAAHPQLREAVVANLVWHDDKARFVDVGAVDTDVDPAGHGTHVAGIVRQVAPDAGLVVLRASHLAENGRAVMPSELMLAAYEWLEENAAEYGVRVVVNAWGTATTADADHPINLATRELYLDGLFVPFAVGNHGDAPAATNAYSVVPWVLSVANAESATAVEASSSRGDPTVAHDHPDVAAPGTRIHSMAVDSDGWAVKTGSSMSAAYVGAVAALMLEVNPSLSPDDVMDILVATARPMPAVPLAVAGAGFVDPPKAVDAARLHPGGLAGFLMVGGVYADPAGVDATARFVS